MKKVLFLLAAMTAATAFGVLDVVTLTYDSVPTNSSAQAYVTNDGLHKGYIEAVSIFVTNATPAYYFSGATNTALTVPNGYYTHYVTTAGSNVYIKGDSALYIWTWNKTTYVSDVVGVLTNIAWSCATNHGGTLGGTNFVVNAASAYTGLDASIGVLSTAQFCYASVDISTVENLDRVAIPLDVYQVDSLAQAKYTLVRTNAVSYPGGGVASNANRILVYESPFKMTAYGALWTGAVVKARVYINTEE